MSFKVLQPYLQVRDGSLIFAKSGEEIGRVAFGDRETTERMSRKISDITGLCVEYSGGKILIGGEQEEPVLSPDQGSPVDCLIETVNIYMSRIGWYRVE